MEIRPARPAEAKDIVRFLDHHAAKGLLLHRSLPEVISHIRDFWVAVDGAGVAGTMALHTVSADLGEIRSLAVRPGLEGKGIGRAFVTAALEDAVRLGLPRVFALTYRPGFFGKLGFRTVDKRTLPQKIWSDCVHCPKFADCDETAVLHEA